MAFREVRVFEVREVLRLWLRGEGLRAVSRLAGMDRKTVRRYVDAGVELGLDRSGGEGQLTDVLLGQVIERVRPHRTDGRGEARRLLDEHRDQLVTWLDTEGLTVVKAHELLERRGVVVPERTLHRYALEELGVGRSVRSSTVRVADGTPGDELQVDFGRLGRIPDAAMTLDRWDDTANITYDRAVWTELCSLRFVDAGHNAVIMGPVGVGKTFLATALGHAAIRRRHSVHFERCDRLLKRLRASRLDNSHEAEIRKLLRVDLLIIDDFALQPMDPVDTADIYELIVERHRTASTVITSNREPVEWLGLMADPLLAQSAIDRLQSAAHELVLDGESYRQRQKPTIDAALDETPTP